MNTTQDVIKDYWFTFAKDFNLGAALVTVQRTSYETDVLIVRQDKDGKLSPTTRFVGRMDNLTAAKLVDFVLEVTGRYTQVWDQWNHIGLGQQEFVMSSDILPAEWKYWTCMSTPAMQDVVKIHAAAPLRK